MKELAIRLLCEEVLDSSMMLITLLGCMPLQLVSELLVKMEKALVASTTTASGVMTSRPKSEQDITNLFNTQELATTSLMEGLKNGTSDISLKEVNTIAPADFLAAASGTFCVAQDNITKAIIRVRGFQTALKAHTKNGSVVAPTYTEWWPLLATHTTLIDGNVGKEMTVAEYEALAGRKVSSDESSATKKSDDSETLKEYDFDLKSNVEGTVPSATTAASANADGEGETTAAAATPAVKSAKVAEDPRLMDPACPISLIRSERPADVTCDPIVYSSLLKALNKDAPAKVQFSQIYFREELGEDEDVPSTVEELGSDADEDDLAELNFKQQMRDNKRALVHEAKRQGVLLNTDLPIAQSGRTYFRSFHHDAIMFAPVANPITSSNEFWSEIPIVASTMVILDNKLYVGHVDGSISMLYLDASSISKNGGVAIAGRVPADKAHKGVPVSDIIPYKRNYTDMADCAYYHSFSSRICPHPEDTVSGDSNAHFREKRFEVLIKATSTDSFADGSEIAEDGKPFSTGIVTASKTNRHIRIWSHNNLLTSPSVEANRLEASASVALKDPMSRCFFARVVRRGMDMKSLRQNIGNPEDMRSKREEDYVSMLSELIAAASAADSEDPMGASSSSSSLDSAGKPKTRTIAQRRKLAQTILGQMKGANDTVLLQYGSNPAATQHPADADFNGHSFVGADGIIQCVAALSFPPGHAVQAATVGPVGEFGEARLVVAISRDTSIDADASHASVTVSLSEAGNETRTDTIDLPTTLPAHYIVQYNILRSI